VPASRGLYRSALKPNAVEARGDTGGARGLHLMWITDELIGQIEPDLPTPRFARPVFAVAKVTAPPERGCREQVYLAITVDAIQG
jgi:hypothetical protein